MRLIIGLLIFCCIPGCNKENNNLGAEYLFLVGEWESSTNSNGSKVVASFKKNGKVIIETEAQRGVKVKLESLFLQKDQVYNNQSLLYLIYNGKNDEQVGLMKKTGATDTIYIYMVFVESDTLKGLSIPIIRKK